MKNPQEPVSLYHLWAQNIAVNTGFVATKKAAKGIVNMPQDVVKDAAWYYENKGSIDLICYPRRLPSIRGSHVHSRYKRGRWSPTSTHSIAAFTRDPEVTGILGPQAKGIHQRRWELMSAIVGTIGVVLLGTAVAACIWIICSTATDLYQEWKKKGGER